MRLPLRHPPPASDSPLMRCAHLEALAESATGLPLGAAAKLLAGPRSRGRHGNALQWHLGLECHDGQAVLDWEDRIEIKLVSIWRRKDGEVACDKVKVCDLGIDPWRKLSNVLWVFADRLSRVVVGHQLSHLGGETRLRLGESWGLDPHFDHPSLFVEAREGDDSSSPAYYLAARWLREEGVLSRPEALYGFDPRWWSEVRQRHRGRDPLLTVTWDKQQRVPCPRCSGSIRAELDARPQDGWWPAVHELPLGPDCATSGHVLLQGERLPRSPAATPLETLAMLEDRLDPTALWRLSDRVSEPEDHLH